MLEIVRAVLVAALQVIALAVLVPVVVVLLMVAAKLMSIIMARAGALPRRLELRKARAPGVQVGKQ